MEYHKCLLQKRLDSSISFLTPSLHSHLIPRLLIHFLQEDSHLADLSFNADQKQHLFGVFDGHGGKEVALYTASNFSDILRNSNAYKSKEYKEGLRESFLNVDVKISSEDGKKELAEIKKKNPPNKSPLFKILGEAIGNQNSATDGEDGINGMGLDAIGCTANVVLVDQMDKLIVANAGDSRAVLSRNGKAVALSFDHKPDN